MMSTDHAGALRKWTEGMRGKGTLGAFSVDEVVGMVMTALDRARRHYENYGQRHGRSAMMRSLRRIQRLADAAHWTPEDRQRLLVALGDGRALDHLLSLAMGHEMDAGTAAANAAGRGAVGQAVQSITTAVDFALRFASAGRGARRTEKFFAVLALAFVFVRLTGRVPTYTTVVPASAREGKGKHEQTGRNVGDRAGDFVDFVEAAHRTWPIPQGDMGFDRAVTDVLFVGSAMLDAAVVMRDCLDPLDQPPFGSPDFAPLERETKPDPD